MTQTRKRILSIDQTPAEPSRKQWCENDCVRQAQQSSHFGVFWQPHDAEEAFQCKNHTNLHLDDPFPALFSFPSVLPLRFPAKRAAITRNSFSFVRGDNLFQLQFEKCCTRENGKSEKRVQNYTISVAYKKSFYFAATKV
jgi:hypothetical protein